MEPCFFSRCFLGDWLEVGLTQPEELELEIVRATGVLHHVIYSPKNPGSFTNTIRVREPGLNHCISVFGSAMEGPFGFFGSNPLGLWLHWTAPGLASLASATIELARHTVRRGSETRRSAPAATFRSAAARSTTTRRSIDWLR